MVQVSGAGEREHWSTAVHVPDLDGIACIQDCRHPSGWCGYGFKSSDLLTRGRDVFALIVRFTVLPDHLEAFDALVSDTLAQIARHEPATLVYVSHERSDRPQERVFYECYQSDDAFAFHEAQVHTIRFLQERGQHLVGPPEVWRMATLSGVINGELRAK